MQTTEGSSTFISRVIARLGLIFALGLAFAFSSPLFANSSLPNDTLRGTSSAPLQQVIGSPVVVSPVVQDTTVPAGSEFEVEIQADEVQNLAGVEATFTYDPDLLELLEVNLASEFQGCFNTINDTTPGILILVLACSTGHPTNPPVSPLTIWTLKLRAASDINGPTSTKLNVVDTFLGDSQVPPQEIPSVGDMVTIVIFPGVCGDQNGDGLINVLDAIIDLQIIVGLVEPTPIQKILSDVVIDGEINVKDAILILQHIAGLTRITECGSAIEIDFFERTRALVGLEMPDGTVNKILRGPTEIHVFFEGRVEGEANDDDGDGLDEVRTELVRMNLTGGGFKLTVRDSDEPPFRRSFGQIEEKVNNHPGSLDLDPFNDGDANSFFDVFFQIETPDGAILHNNDPLRLEAMISEKPPKTRYTHVITEPIMLFDENDEPTGIRLVTADHDTRPHFVEHDHFEDTEAQITLLGPEEFSETVDLSGPTWIDVWFERREGEADDDDGDGLDDVMTKVEELNLEGQSSLGPVRVGLNPNIMSTGEIEEKVNNVPGVLDIPPFGQGAANSSFEIFLVVEVNGRLLFAAEPKVMRGMISHKPPDIGEFYENPDVIPLVDENGEPTGFSIGPARHVPRPHFVEHDHFDDTEAQITIIGPDGSSETIDLSGPTWIDVWFERREGEARDDDGDGLDDVMTKVIDMRLFGEGSGGPIIVRPNPDIMSTGVIEEKQNDIPGILEVPPFAPGAANSSFDMFFQIIMPEQNVVLHTAVPKVMRGMIFHKPPDELTVYENPQTIPLLFPNGEFSGFSIGPATHRPRPHFVEHDHFDETEAEITLVNDETGESETVTLSGPTWIDVWFERREGEARDDDDNGLDEVMTKVTGLDLRGDSSMGPVHVTLNPNIMSTGVIEEKQNDIPGVLEVPPFAPGRANSSFRMFFQIEIGDMVFQTETPKVMRSMISHKPPIDPGTVYESPTTIPLLKDGKPTGLSLGPATHRPNPHFVEHDHFEDTEAKINILGPDGFNETIEVRGPTWIDVWFENREGQARDDDDDGLDEVMTKVKGLRLVGRSEALGTVVVGLNPNVMSTGMIRENSNDVPGVLEVPPFAPGSATSWFDINLQIELVDRGLVLQATRPKSMHGVIFHKPPLDPSTVYENREIIPLVLPTGEATGFSIGPATHVPRPHFVERDHFEDTEAEITLVNDDTGETETVKLSGPTWIDVWFERREGEARDDDGNGLDEVMTKVRGLRLEGESSFGPILVGLNPEVMSTGMIEEKENNIPGILEVPPFAPGAANSWFDINLLVVVDGRVLVARQPKKMHGMLFHKPPLDSSTVYENPETIPLLLPNGERSGISIGPAKHTPVPHFVEHDHFDETEATINLIGPNLNETIDVRGPTWVDVWFERREGEARDDDGNGLDEVMTKVTGLDLKGESPTLGPVRVGLSPFQMSMGTIEEKVNSVPGMLDLPPFGQGAANSEFEIWFEIEVAGRVFHAARPKIMRSMITHKPPIDPGTVYENPDTIPLLDEEGNETGFFIGPATHRPRPHFVERDHFEDTEAEITLVNDETGESETVKLSGPTWIDVWFERREGEAQDDDDNGLDEVMTRVRAMRLMGESSMGPVLVELHPSIPSRGVIEEKENNTPGTLDVPPFTEGGGANSWFDINFAITMLDKNATFFTARPKRMSGMIFHKPPIDPGTVYENPETIPLLLPNGERSGFSIGPAKHTPVPHFVEHDHFEQTEAVIDLIKPGGSSEKIRLVGPTWVDVWFERGEGDAQDDDGNGLDEVMTKVQQLDLRGMSSMGPVFAHLNPAKMSTGIIEEKVNNVPGRLDLDPFEPGDANSSFDIFLALVVSTPNGDVELFADQPKKMRAMITEKPPAPGETYESPETIPLFFANGEPSGFAIGPGTHTPRHFVEHDHFDQTEAEIIIINADTGAAETVQLAGPTWIDVWFENREGFAHDDDGDGLDEVMTKVVQMDLEGQSSMGLIKVSLNPDIMSTGTIMEKANKVPGRLEVPPFEDGLANSWFDIWFQVELEDGTILHAKEPKQMHGMITHKPPDIGDFYMNPDRIQLFDEAGNPTPFFIGPANHVPVPGHAVEVDIFEQTNAKMTLMTPTGSTESISLSGPAEVHVWFEGPNEGDAKDHDGNGLDEVMAKFVNLKLSGESQIGTVLVGLNPAMMSVGIIEEKENNIPGVLEISPFVKDAIGANSSFEMFVEIDVANEVLLHNEEPKILKAMITEKPPAPGETYESPNVIPLFTQDGKDSGFKLGSATHTPNPRDEPPVIEIDVFPNTEALVAVGFQDFVENVILTGPAETHVFFEGPKEGDAQDDDNDGMDEVRTEMVSMELSGVSEILGPFKLRAGSLLGIRPTLGEIVEHANAIPGTLEVEPFSQGGTADSSFEVWFEVEAANTPVGALLAHNEEPTTMVGRLTHKPPAPGDEYIKVRTQPIELFDTSGVGTGIFIVSASHIPNPLPDLTVAITSGPNVNCFGPIGAVQCDVTVSFDVTNISSVDVTSDIDLLLVADQVPNSTDTIVGGLGAGQTVNVTINSAPGGNCFDPDCFVEVTVDPANAIPESDETNNSDNRSLMG